MSCILGLENSVPIILYDLSIPVLEDRIRKAKEFKSINECCLYLGCTTETLKRYCVPGGRLLSRKLKKRFAPRFKKGYHLKMTNSASNFLTING